MIAFATLSHRSRLPCNRIQVSLLSYANNPPNLSLPIINALTLSHPRKYTKVSRVGKAAIISKGAATIHFECGAPFDPFLICLVAAGELAALGIVRNSFKLSEFDPRTGGWECMGVIHVPANNEEPWSRIE